MASSSKAGGTRKTKIIARIFDARWNADTKTLSGEIVTFEDIAESIQGYNQNVSPAERIGRGNIYAFFKDFIRNLEPANRNWPPSVLERGFTGQQLTGGGQTLSVSYPCCRARLRLFREAGYTATRRMRQLRVFGFKALASRLR